MGFCDRFSVRLPHLLTAVPARPCDRRCLSDLVLGAWAGRFLWEGEGLVISMSRAGVPGCPVWARWGQEVCAEPHHGCPALRPSVGRSQADPGPPRCTDRRPAPRPGADAAWCQRARSGAWVPSRPSDRGLSSWPLAVPHAQGGWWPGRGPAGWGQSPAQFREGDAQRSPPGGDGWTVLTPLGTFQGLSQMASAQDKVSRDWPETRSPCVSSPVSGALSLAA